MTALNTIFGQRDPRWKDKQLGTGNGTIGPFGCFVTVCAMIASDFWQTTYPDNVNDAFVKNGLYVKGDELQDDVMQRAGMPLWGMNLTTATRYFETSRADLSLLALAEDNMQTYVKIATPAVPSHFMRVAASDGGAGIVVDDPWNGDRRAFGDTFGGSDPATSIVKITQVRHVAVVNPPPAPPPPPAPTYITKDQLDAAINAALVSIRDDLRVLGNQNMDTLVLRKRIKDALG